MNTKIIFFMIGFLSTSTITHTQQERSTQAQQDPSITAESSQEEKDNALREVLKRWTHTDYKNAKQNKQDIIDLIRIGANPNTTEYISDTDIEKGIRPLYAFLFDYNGLQVILDLGADPTLPIEEIPHTINRKRIYALHCVDNVKTARLLMQYGAEVTDGVLCQAISRSSADADLIPFFIAKGANPHYLGKGNHGAPCQGENGLHCLAINCAYISYYYDDYDKKALENYRKKIQYLFDAGLELDRLSSWEHGSEYGNKIPQTIARNKFRKRSTDYPCKGCTFFDNMIEAERKRRIQKPRIREQKAKREKHRRSLINDPVREEYDVFAEF